MFTSIRNRMRQHIERRQRYDQLAAEIRGMSDRDIADIRGNRTDMLRHVYNEVYGS